MFGHATAWLLTYALHSTLLLALAWLASGPLGRRSLRLEEAVWRVALLGALATSTFQVATGWHPVGALHLPAAIVARTATPAALSPTSPIAPTSPTSFYKEETLGSASGVSLSRVARVAEVPAAPELREAATTPAAEPSSPAPAPEPVWMARLIGLWVAVAFLLSLRLAFAHLSLRRRLRARLEVSGGTLLRILDRLAPAAGFSRPIRLTCSPVLPVPVALGLLRPEIAVPPRTLSHLSAGEQESLLAHELAHLVRRDPVWLAGGQLLTSLLFFQPLNWVARRRLREISELLSDEWAVGRTGEPLSLARCLAEVAQWTLEPVRLLPVPGMADRPSNLSRRIHRLLDGERERIRMPRWGLAVLGVLVLSMAVVAPGFTAAERPAVPPAPPAPLAPEVAPAPEAPEAPEIVEAPEAPETPPAPVVAPVPPVPPAPSVPKAPRAARPPHPPRLPRPALAAPPAPPAPLPHHGLSAEERAEMEAVRERAEDLAESGHLDAEEIARIQADAEHLSREMEEHLKPRMEELEKLAAQAAAQRPNDAELQDLERQVDAATRHLRSPEEEARFEADVRKLAESSGSLSPEERKHLEAEVRRMAESMRPRPEELVAMKKLAERHAQLSHQLSREQIEKMKTVRQEIEKEMAAMRQTLQRDMAKQFKDMHEELRQERERREALPRPHPRPRIAPKLAPAPRPHPGALPAPAPQLAPVPASPPAPPEGALLPPPPPAA
jgi:beta-lactamase regulating signal transducer with metallopeptidase domain